MIDLVLTVVVAVLGCALLLAVVVIWSIKRHRDPRLRIESDAPLAELLPSLSGLTYGVALKGNAVDILENGAFFEVMFEEIGRARSRLAALRYRLPASFLMGCMARPPTSPALSRCDPSLLSSRHTHLRKSWDGFRDQCGRSAPY